MRHKGQRTRAAFADVAELFVRHVESSRRHYIIPLDPLLAQICLRWRSKSRLNGDDDWVFARREDHASFAVDPAIVRCHIQEAALKAGLGDGIGWQTFRRTYAAELLKLGTSIGTTQKLLRHSAITTTLRMEMPPGSKICEQPMLNSCG